MGTVVVTTRNEEETKRIAEELVRLLPSSKRTARVLALSGELGTGKTRFAQGVGRALGMKKRITSPTFVISKEYRLSSRALKRHGFRAFYHLDFYRLSRKKDLIGVDFEDSTKKPNTLIVIEWAERIKRAIPADAIWIKFEGMGDKERRITIG